MIVIAAAALFAPWLATALAMAAPARLTGIARVAAALTGIGFLAALVFGIAAAVRGGPVVSFGGGAFALTLDGFAVVMLALVLGLSAVIQSFAVRYLRGDLRQRWFVVAANLLAGSTLVLVSAGSVVMFVIGWLAAGASLVLLLNTYSTDRQARDGVRRTTGRFAIGDAALIVAAGVLIGAGGTDLALAEVGGVVAALPVPLAVVVGMMLVLPALARSSQIPFHGWLPATLAAPTPVSALLHAGVVNAGAVLLIRFSPAIAGSAVVMAVIFVAGAATLVYASAVRLTKPDIKGRLVFSTMAQMGFMIMACALGAYAAAVFHLIAHGLYKSALFLAAGGGVNRSALRRAWPARAQTSPVRTGSAVLLALLVPIAALGGARVLFAAEISAASLALLAFVAFTGAVTLGATLMVRISGGVVVASFLGIGVLALSYTALVAAFDTLIGPISATGAVSPWWVLVPAILLLVIQWLASPAGRPAAFHDLLYTRALTAGAPGMLSMKGLA